MRGAGMGEQGALGLAGGTGGVDDVGQIVRTQAGDIRRAGIIVLSIGNVVQGQHAHAQHGATGWEMILQIGAGQHCARAAVLQQEGQAFAGQFRIQRHIRRAGLERGEHRDHLLDAARQVQGDSTLHTDAGAAQTLGEPIGAAIQFGIAQGALSFAHRDGIGCALYLRFEQGVDAGGRWKRRALGDSEALQLHAFVGGQQRQLRDAGVHVGDHAAQQGHELSQMAFDGAAVEQRRGIPQAADDTILLLVQRELQIELGIAGLCRERLQPNVGQDQLGLGHVLPCEHDLEHRLRRQTALGIERFDHLFERHVLVILRGQCGDAHLGQQVGDGGRTAQIDAQCLGVDEEPDQRFEFAAGAIGDGCADHHLVLTRQS